MSLLDCIAPPFRSSDFFISYGHEDGRTYARALAAALRQRGFRCFIDESEFFVGEPLVAATRRALGRTSVLVLVGSAYALRSAYVRQELELAVSLDVSIVPVDMGGEIARGIAAADGASAEAPVLALLGDRLRPQETAMQLAIGPSPRALDQICAAFQGIRVLRRRVRRISTIAAVFVAVTAAAAFAGYLAWRNAEDARAQGRRAQARALAVRSATASEPHDAGLQANLMAAIASAALDPGPDNHRALQDLIARLVLPRALLRLPDPPADLAYAADGDRLFTVSGDGTVSVVDAGTGKTLATRRLAGEPRTLAVDPRDRWLAVAGDLKPAAVHILDTGNLDPVATIPRGSDVWDLAFSHDGQMLAVAGAPLTVHASGSWERLPVARASTFPGRTVAFSPGDVLLAAGSSWSPQTVLFDVASATRRTTIRHRDQSRSMAFSADGRTLAIAQVPYRLQFWNVDPAVEMTVGRQAGAAAQVAYTPDGRWLVTRELGGMVVRDAQLQTEHARMIGAGAPGALTLHPSGREAAVATRGGVAVFPIRRSDELARAPLTERADLARFTRDGRRLVVATWDRLALVLDVVSGEWIAAPAAGSSITYDVDTSPDGRRLVTANHDGHVRLFHIDGESPIWDLSLQGRARHVRFSADGRRVAAATASGRLRVLDAVSGGTLAEAVFPSAVHALYWSADDTRLVLVGTGVVGAVDAASGDTVWQRRSTSESRAVFALDRIGHRFAWGVDGEPLVVLDTRAGKERLRLTESRMRSDVQFSRDGRRLAVAPSIGPLEVRDGHTGKRLGTLGSDRTSHRTLRFSDDGAYLASVDRVARTVIVHAVTRGTEVLRLPYRGDVFALHFEPGVPRLRMVARVTAREHAQPSTLIVSSTALRTRDLLREACARIVDPVQWYSVGASYDHNPCTGVPPLSPPG